jgi:transposase-like protein
MQLNNLIEITKYFEDKDTCLSYLTSMRWPKGNVECVFCSHPKVYQLKGANKHYKCASCRKQFSAIKGTIFENSPVSLQKWFTAIYILGSHKKGISSVQLGKDLSVRQATAWFMMQRIRYALKVKTFDKQAFGLLQLDETFIGGKNKNRHAHKKVPNSQGRSFKDKTPVLGMLRTGGNVHTVVIPDTKATTIKPIIKCLVSNGSILITDEWLGYTGLKKDYAHIVINHKEQEYVRGAFHTNGIENYWSLLKRGIYGIYHQVSPKHLHRYCDEFSFRYNTRRISDKERFKVLLESVNCRLTYKELTTEYDKEKIDSDYSQVSEVFRRGYEENM